MPSIALHLTDTCMHTAQVSTKPGGSEDTFPPSPQSANGPRLASLPQLDIASPVPSPSLGRQQDWSALGGPATAPQHQLLRCSRGRYPGRLTSTVGLDCCPNRSAVCLGGDVGSRHPDGMLSGSKPSQSKRDLWFVLEAARS